MATIRIPVLLIGSERVVHIRGSSLCAIRGIHRTAQGAVNVPGERDHQKSEDQTQENKNRDVVNGSECFGWL